MLERLKFRKGSVDLFTAKLENREGLLTVCVRTSKKIERVANLHIVDFESSI